MLLIVMATLLVDCAYTVIPFATDIETPCTAASSVSAVSLVAEGVGVEVGVTVGADVGVGVGTLTLGASVGVNDGTELIVGVGVGVVSLSCMSWA